MRLRAVLFDLDDTLHDKSATLREVATRQYEAAGLAASGVGRDAWVDAYLGLNHQRIEKSVVFAELARTFALTDALARQLLDDFDADLGRSAHPFPAARELLLACRARGWKVGIVTNGRDAFQRSKIVGMGFEALVDVVVTSGGFGAKKPDPAIFRECLERLAVAPTESAFVGGDHAADIEPALALGMRAVWKSPGTCDRAAFCSNDLSAIRAYLSTVG
jgi:putative hydrolase of the HAD superfamily